SIVDRRAVLPSGSRDVLGLAADALTLSRVVLAAVLIPLLGTGGTTLGRPSSDRHGSLTSSTVVQREHLPGRHRWEGSTGGPTRWAGPGPEGGLLAPGGGPGGWGGG